MRKEVGDKVAFAYKNISVEDAAEAEDAVSVTSSPDACNLPSLNLDTPSTSKKHRGTDAADNQDRDQNVEEEDETAGGLVGSSTKEANSALPAAAMSRLPVSSRHGRPKR